MCCVPDSYRVCEPEQQLTHATLQATSALQASYAQTSDVSGVRFPSLSTALHRCATWLAPRRESADMGVMSVLEIALRRMARLAPLKRIVGVILVVGAHVLREHSRSSRGPC